MTAHERPVLKSPVVDKIAPLTYVGVQERLPNGWSRFKIRKAGAGIADLIVDPAKSTFDAYVRAESEDNYIARSRRMRFASRRSGRRPGPRLSRMTLPGSASELDSLKSRCC